MRYGLCLTNLGDYAEPATVVRLARSAEAHGWEALFIWDHLGFAWGVPSGDPLVMLSAIAANTSRIRLGTAVAVLPRHRPHVPANQMATLDRLSGGRLVLGVGSGGVPREFDAFGETTDPTTRASMLDEGIGVVDELLSGGIVDHRGEHYTVKRLTLAPPPLQRPRVPIWVGGTSHAAVRRASRWDGWVPAVTDETGAVTVWPDEVAARVACLPDARPFEVAVIGQSEGPGLPAAYAGAGATLWLEMLHGLRGSCTDMLELVTAGPEA